MLPSCVEIEECLWIHDMAVGVGYGYGIYRHFQQYFSYLVVVSFICRENRGNPPTCPKSLQTLSHNVGSSTPRLSGILTFNVVGHMHRLQR